MKGTKQKSSGGFTLIELLVVVAIVLILAALAFVGIGKMTLAAHKAESMNNIRALSGLTVAGTTDNNGEFPQVHSTQNSTAPYWFSMDFREENGLSPSQCYSSANKCWKRDGWDHCGDRPLWDWPGGVSSVWGYICLINDNGWADSGDFIRPDNWDSIQDRVRVGNEVRWVPERMGQEVAYPILWLDLTRQWDGGIVGNFMKNETEIKGAHVGYLDGHVEWVRGEDLKPRFRGSATLYW